MNRNTTLSQMFEQLTADRDEHTTESEPLTIEQLEAKRQAAIVESRDYLTNTSKKMDELIGKIIEKLQLNRKHIGGVHLVVTAKHDSTFIHEDGGTCDTMVVHVGMNRVYEHSLRHYALEKLNEG